MSTKNPKQERVPQAPRAPLPELAEFLAPLRVQFTQGPSAETLRQYLTGLLSEHPNKTVTPWRRSCPRRMSNSSSIC